MILEQKFIARFTNEEREYLSKLASINCQDLGDFICDECPFDLNGRCVKAEIRCICNKNNIEFT